MRSFPKAILNVSGEFPTANAVPDFLGFFVGEGADYDFCPT
jgi:hypothetical protein